MRTISRREQQRQRKLDAQEQRDGWRREARRREIERKMAAAAEAAEQSRMKKQREESVRDFFFSGIGGDK